MLKLTLLFIVLSLSNHLHAASQCEHEWQRLKQVQALLRHKSTEGLRSRERDAFEHYQACIKGKRKPHKTTKHKKQTLVKPMNNSANKTKKQLFIPPNITNSFRDSKVVIRGLFSGKKQQAWLKWYKPPSECKKPKSTSMFARCLDNKAQKAQEFERVWQLHLSQISQH